MKRFLIAGKVIPCGGKLRSTTLNLMEPANARKMQRPLPLEGRGLKNGISYH